MDKTIDLVDPRQIKLFEALEQLKSLKAAKDIKIPQLIVVGDQSSGKSSILEALARFHFPVNEDLCTRFPTKLILKRSDRKDLKVRFDPQLGSRTGEEKEKLEHFVREVEASSLSYWDDLGDLMVKAADALDVRSQKHSTDQNHSKTSGRQSTKGFTEDILVVEKHGPDLPILSLLDLPGLFRAESNDQNEDDRIMVERILENQIKEPTNLVLVVVTASTTAVNQTVVEKVQKLAQKDCDLLKRVVAVITHPDLDTGRLKVTKGALMGKPPSLGNMELVHKYHVVRNQTTAERNANDSLDHRDSIEKDFFSCDGWKEVPDEQKGIHSLKTTLKDLFWTRTKHELRESIIPTIKTKIVDIDASVKAADTSRANDRQRRDYLCDIAEEFERLIRGGVKGEDLLRYQSARWAKIAERHVQAVCEETGKYLALALKRTCADEHVRQAIQDRIISPNFEILQREANRTLTHLLECHRTGNPGFFDSFGDAFTVQEQAKDLVQRLDLFDEGYLERVLGKDFIKNIKYGLGILMWSSVSPVSSKGSFGVFVLKQAYDILLKQFNWSNGTEKKANEPDLDHDHDYNAAAVIAGVECYYKTTMIAFVGYVNALVIEADILRELESRIFSQRLIRYESQALINEIAAEDEDKAAKRKEKKQELESLKSILKTLEEGLTDKK
ncbi:uncharacterized protein BDZ99DRAFT_565876 [Neofusicoccum parvum]|nr:uncharacterized protein BDZ99DRAFT_565876 [Neofusicoccum parvum]